MSTHAAVIRIRCPALNSFRKNSSSVSFFRSRPNHNGSLLSRLLTTVMNFCFFPRWISSTPICLSAGFRRASAHRSRYRRSIARTVLAANPNCRATWRAAALSHACPTASSNRLLNGALLGNCGTFSILMPQSGQQHPVHLYDDGGPEFHAGQIPHFPLAHIVGRLQLAAASGAHQFPIAALAPYPQLQRLARSSISCR